MNKKLLALTLVLASLVIVELNYIACQHAVINALIDLNHDKSVYIDSGCNGRYQGTEEMLSSEVKGSN